MKIRYSKKRLFSTLLLGGLFTLMGALKIYEGGAHFFHYFQLVFGIAVLASHLFERHYQYLTIEEGFLTKNSIKRKTIRINDFRRIQSFPGKIKLFTSKEKLRINTEVINEDSLKDFYQVLGALELQPEENPFTGWSQTRSGSK